MTYFINYSHAMIYKHRMYFYLINRKKYSTYVIISCYVIHVIIMHDHKGAYNSLMTLRKKYKLYIPTTRNYPIDMK